MSGTSGRRHGVGPVHDAALILVLCVSSIALAIEITGTRFDGWLAWLPWPSDYYSLGGAAAIALVGFIAAAHPSAYHPRAALGTLDTVGAMAAGALLVLHVDLTGARVHLSPVAGPTSGRTIGEIALRVLVGILVTNIVIRLLQLRRLSFRWRSQERSVAKSATLLPSQERVVAQMIGAIDVELVGSAGQVVQIQGRWGDGKTFVLREAVRRLELREQPRTATAWFDVWENSSTTDLHREIVSQVLAHPLHTCGMRWLALPIFVPRFMGSQWNLTARLSGAEVAVPFKLPELPYQKAFERAIGRSGAERTVLVLDEIDRANPVTAQTALTLLRRSLDSSGVHAIVPYVEDVLFAKAFSTRVPMLDDMESSLHAVLFEKVSPSGALFDSLVANIRFRGANGTGPGPAADGQDRANGWILGDAYQAAAADLFESLPRDDRRAVQRQTSAKMLHSRPIRMPIEIPLAELAEFVGLSDIISEQLRGPLHAQAGSLPIGTFCEDVARVLLEGARVLDEDGTMTQVPLRDFQATVCDVLAILEEPGFGAPASLSDLTDFVAMAVAATVYAPGTAS